MCEYCEKLKLIDLPEADESESSFSAHIDHINHGDGYSLKSYHVLNVSHVLDLGYCGDKYFEADILINYCPFCGRKLSN